MSCGLYQYLCTAGSFNSLKDCTNVNEKGAGAVLIKLELWKETSRCKFQSWTESTWHCTYPVMDWAPTLNCFLFSAKSGQTEREPVRWSAAVSFARFLLPSLVRQKTSVPALGTCLSWAKECTEVCGLCRRMGWMRMVRSGFIPLLWIFRFSTNSHAALSSTRKFLFMLWGLSGVSCT